MIVNFQDKQPSSPTGYYHVNNQLIYCNVEELCSIEGGWTRQAYLDMSDSTMSCIRYSEVCGRVVFRQEVIYSIRAAMKGAIEAVRPHRPPGSTQFIVEGGQVLLSYPGPTKTSWHPCNSIRNHGNHLVYIIV